MRATLTLPSGHDGAVWQPKLSAQRRSTHRHDELEFNLVRRGQARYLVSDRRHDLRQHTLIWLFPDQEHVLLDESPDFDMWVAVFRPTMVRRICRTSQSATLRQRDPKCGISRDLTPNQARRLGSLLQDVVAATGDCFNAGLAYSLLSAWALFESAEDLSPGREVHPAIERAARLIRDEQEPMSLVQLARRARISPWRLSRLFRAQTGVSLVAYRQRQRLQRFLDLYGDGSECKMLDAALRAGFGSYPQFHRVFKQYMGHSPAEHRKRLRAP